MTGKARSERSTALPPAQDIAAFLSSAKGAPSTRDIIRHFGLSGEARAPLNALLKQIEAEGRISRERRGFQPAQSLPASLLADITARDRDGDLMATPADWGQAQGPAPSIAVHVPRRLETGKAALGIGSRVLLRIERNAPGDPAAYSGRVIKVLAKRREQSLGVIRIGRDGKARLVSIDKKARGGPMDIPAGFLNGAGDGDLVSVEPGRENRYGVREARVVERLGSLNSERAVSLIAIHAHAIPHVFSPEALAEAAAARPAALKGREDWRGLPLVTIDPADAKDHDDAVHAEADSSPGNPGGFVLTVAIADVAAYVRPGSAMDREALERGNSVYFPDRVVPMLPERISNDLCSLIEARDRPALAVKIIVSADGAKRGHSFHRIMMRSAAKLAYQQAQSIIDGAAAPAETAALAPVLTPLWECYGALKRARAIRAPLDLDLPERKLLLNADGTVKSVVSPERLDAHKLIEECMVLANVCAAETLERAGAFVMYRAHDTPSPEKVEALREFLKSLNIELPKQGNMRAAHFNHILAKTAKSSESQLVNEVILRSQSQAEYAPENYGHFGLNLRRYAHFTSPIRRYADLLVHRALIRAQGFGKDGLGNPKPEDFRDIAQRISNHERRAMAAERETTDRLIAGFLAERIGASFEGRISGVVKAGLFVKLSETGADGFVPAGSLGGYFEFDETRRALIARAGAGYRLGDAVTVRLVEAQPLAGALRFEVLSTGRTMTGPAGKRSGWRERGRSAPKRSRGRTAPKGKFRP